MFKYKIPLAIAVAAASLLTSTLASADDAALVTQIVDTFYKIYGTIRAFASTTPKAWSPRAALSPRPQRRH